MKKVLSLVIAMLLLFAVCIPCLSYADTNTVSVIFDGKDFATTEFNISWKPDSIGEYALGASEYDGVYFFLQEADQTSSTFAKYDEVNKKPAAIIEGSSFNGLQLLVSPSLESENFNKEKLGVVINGDVYELSGESYDLSSFKGTSITVTGIVLMKDVKTTSNTTETTETTENTNETNNVNVDTKYTYSSITTFKGSLVDNNTETTVYFNGSKEGKSVTLANVSYADTSMYNDYNNWFNNNKLYLFTKDYPSTELKNIILTIDGNETVFNSIESYNSKVDELVNKAVSNKKVELAKANKTSGTVKVETKHYYERNVDVVIPVYTLIDKVVVSGATTTLEYGKKPVFTASLDTDNKDLSVCEEWYCYDTDNKYRSISSDENMNDEDCLISSIEKGNLYNYQPYVEISDSSNYRFVEEPVFVVNGKEYRGYSALYGTTAYLSIGAITFPTVSEEVKEENNENVSKANEEKIKEMIKNDDFTGLDEDVVNYLKDAVENGDEIGGYIDCSVVSKDLIEEEYGNDEETLNKINEKINSASGTLLGFYDINDYITVNGVTVGNMKELKEPVKVCIPLLVDLPELEDGQERTFSIIRIHKNPDGTVEVEEIPCTVENGMIIFWTDRFSLYIPKYTDKSTTTEAGEKASITPKTGDDIVLVALTIVVAIIGTSIIEVKKRN